MLSREEMMREIPHRDVMLLPDSITKGEGKAVGTKVISSNDTLLIKCNDKMLYPTFLLPELMAQVALFTANARGRMPLLLGVKAFQLFSLPCAGDELQIIAESEFATESSGQALCRIVTSDRDIAEGRILYCFKEVDNE